MPLSWIARVLERQTGRPSESFSDEAKPLQSSLQLSNLTGLLGKSILQHFPIESITYGELVPVEGRVMKMEWTEAELS